jgi:large subunit ribosomal protein L13
MKTLTPKPAEITQGWQLIDASDMTLGRLASAVATILRGKNKPYFVPNIDTGDFVVVINAEKVKATGCKALQKVYEDFSGYPSGLHTTSYARMMSEKPEEIIVRAVKGMLPKNALGRQMLSKLKVYAGPTHPHEAQKPVQFTL